MIALPLFDVLLSPGDTPEFSLNLGEKLIQSTLVELEQIQLLDAALMPPEGPFDRQRAALLRGMYEDWVGQAEALETRVRQLEKRRASLVNGSRELGDACGRIRAMLSISLDDLEEGLKEIKEGRTVPLEEVRRELRLGVQ